MKKTFIDAPHLKGDTEVSVTEMGNILEIKYLSSYNTSISIQKIDQNHYVDKETGEIKEFQKSENRSENVKSISATFKNLRELINANYDSNSPECLLWLTLTFKENERDPKVFSHCFDVFWKRMKRWFQRNSYEIPKYITCVEPQSRGAWHGHMILFFSSPAPFIPNNEVLEKYWEWGFTNIQRLDNVTNVGAYLTAYLTDIPVEEAQSLVFDNDISFDKYSEIKSIQGIDVDKKFIKGGRLKFYPVGMKLYRCSQGLKQPFKYRCSYSHAKDLVQGCKCIYERHIEIEIDDFKSIISTRQFDVS